jgi:hypothetical protein
VGPHEGLRLPQRCRRFVRVAALGQGQALADLGDRFVDSWRSDLVRPEPDQVVRVVAAVDQRQFPSLVERDGATRLGASMSGSTVAFT